MIIEVTYGPGGCDTTHPDYPKNTPNGNVVEELVDNGDGTATRRFYVDGKVSAGETVAYTAPEPAALSAEEKVAELAALLVEKGVATEAEVASKLERAAVADVAVKP